MFLTALFCYMDPFLLLLIANAINWKEFLIFSQPYILYMKMGICFYSTCFDATIMGTLIYTTVLSKCALPCTLESWKRKSLPTKKEGKAISKTCNCGRKYEWYSDRQQKKRSHCGKIWLWIEPKGIFFCHFFV